MSKKSKQAVKDRNRKAKRAAKDAARARYAAWAAAGTNKKSARAKARAKSGKKVSRVGRHLHGSCTNEGCVKCNPNTPGTNPWLASPGSCIYPKRWTSHLWAK